jgi:hypothetical protein
VVPDLEGRPILSSSLLAQLEEVVMNLKVEAEEGRSEEEEQIGLEVEEGPRSLGEVEEEMDRLEGEVLSRRSLIRC